MKSLVMSKRERKRLEVFSQVKSGKLTLLQYVIFSFTWRMPAIPGQGILRQSDIHSEPLAIACRI